MMPRRLLFGAILLAHLLLLALAARIAPPVRPVDAAAPPLMVTELPPPASAPPPRLPPPVVTIAAPPPPPPELAPAAPLLPDTSGCTVTAAVSTALANDPAVGEALREVPQSARSVANALVVWDAGWVSRPEDGGSFAIVPTRVRAAILAALAVAPASCLDQMLAGPRLFVIDAGGTATTLAIGSGAWRWRDVMASTDSPDVPQASIGSHRRP